jgi:low affinity Fe/Cu permease
MIFFLQHSQNVSDKATHLKLDELIRAVQGARNEVAAAEDREEYEIDALKQASLKQLKDATALEKESG